MTVVWHGDREESGALVTAIAKNCACVFGLMGMRVSTCEPHQALVSDQRFLDGLLVMRHYRDKLLLQEFTI